MRFIRKGGRVIPIRENSSITSGSKKVIGGGGIIIGSGAASVGLAVASQFHLRNAVLKATAARAAFSQATTHTEFAAAYNASGDALKKLAQTSMKSHLTMGKLNKITRGIKLGGAALGLVGMAQIAKGLLSKKKKSET